MKYLAETNGEYGLHDLIGRQVVAANRPTVVTATPFIERLRGTRLTVLEILADEAQDTALAFAKTPEELEEAIAALPRAEKTAKKSAAKPARA